MRYTVLCFVSAVLLFTLLPMRVGLTVEVTPAPPHQYRLEVSGLPRVPNGRVLGFNDLGHATFFRVPGGGFRWDGTAEHSLYPSGALIGIGEDINNAGRIAGHTYGTNWPTLATIWDNGVLKFIGNFGGTQSRAEAVNEAGVVAGWYEVGGQKRLFTWDGTMTDRGPMPGSLPTIVAMNDNLQIVGYSLSPRSAWVWEDGSFRELPDHIGGSRADPIDINSSGVVVGYAHESPVGQQAMVWEDAIGYPLVEPDGFFSSYALGINDKSIIVGNVSGIAGDEATVWIDGEVFLLENLVSNLDDWQLERAIDIDAQGRILVEASSPMRPRVHLILHPIEVPEPSTWTLIVIGSACAGLREWWRR